MKNLYLFFLFFINFYCGYSQSLYPGDTIGTPYEINFDTGYYYINIDTNSSNLWQIGVPQKVFFNSSYTFPKAIVTDTLNNYPINNSSFFDLYIGNFITPYLFYPYDIFFDFWHKFDTDTLKDGCYITVSWDKGLTWTNIINDTIYGQYFGGTTPGYWNTYLYSLTDTLYNGEYGFLGKSNGWVHTSFAWLVFPVKLDFPPDTMILRFNFISDSINNNKEGWMIDRIRMFSIDLGGGIHSLLSDNNIATIYPNPFNNNTEISLNKIYVSCQKTRVKI